MLQREDRLTVQEEEAIIDSQLAELNEAPEVKEQIAQVLSLAQPERQTNTTARQRTQRMICRIPPWIGWKNDSARISQYPRQLRRRSKGEIVRKWNLRR